VEWRLGLLDRERNDRKSEAALLLLDAVRSQSPGSCFLPRLNVQQRVQPMFLSPRSSLARSIRGKTEYYIFFELKTEYFRWSAATPTSFGGAARPWCNCVRRWTGRSCSFFPIFPSPPCGDSDLQVAHTNLPSFTSTSSQISPLSLLFRHKSEILLVLVYDLCSIS
jgi:hypothetical protein